MSNLINDLTYFVDFVHWKHAVPDIFRKVRRMLNHQVIRHAHFFYASIFVRVVDALSPAESRPLLWENTFMGHCIALLLDPSMQASENADIQNDLATVLAIMSFDYRRVIVFSQSEEGKAAWQSLQSSVRHMPFY